MKNSIPNYCLLFLMLCFGMQQSALAHWSASDIELPFHIDYDHPVSDVYENTYEGLESDPATSLAYADDCPAGSILFVDADATGANDGSSWIHAFTNLQDALNSTCPGISQIWVAVGTYYPDQGIGQSNNNRNSTFQLQNGLAIYGGFAGTETSLGDRNWVTNETILSGDINQSGTLANNAYTVVTSSGLNSTAVIDGFTITMGNNDESGGGGGGGMFNLTSAPTVANCTFSGNTSTFNGGGMFNQGISSPTLTNCIFSGNSSGNGGGICNNNASSPIIMNCSFTGNPAVSGGGIANFDHSSPTVTNCIFSGNSAGLAGGGIFSENSSSPTVTNCSFSGNTATAGGGMGNQINSFPTVTNCIIWNNTASGNSTSASASVFNQVNSAPTFSYSLIANSGGSGSWVAAIGTNAGNNIDADPLFTDAANGDFTLIQASPALNAGDPATILNLFPGGPGAPVDLAGNPRVMNGFIDMGPFEIEVICPAGSNLYVDVNAAGLNNGTSWTNAYTSLQVALKNPCPGISEIWVADGTYLPTSGSDRNASFIMKDGLAIYGGFNGTETNLTQRNLAGAPSFLSGDIGAMGDNADNSFTIVRATGLSNTAILDGFTLTAGNANGSASLTDPDNNGGAMYLQNASPLLRNLIFTQNAASDGGAIFSVNSSPVLTNCIFDRNTSGRYGGGFYALNGSNPQFINCTFSGNTAVIGGGATGTTSSTTTLLNAIIWGNGSPFFNLAASTNATFSIINGGHPGTGNLNVDPIFIDAANGNVNLDPCSPAIYAGTPTGAPVNDILGNPRNVNGGVSMGAYEHQGAPCCPTGSVVYVDATATGNNNGTSWTHAFNDLQDALNSTCPDISEIWVAEGTYYPDQGEGQTENNRNASFQMKNGLAIYGGFAGSETQLDQRDWEENETVLSGDIGAQGVSTDNSYHVLSAGSGISDALLDGFTVTGGHANGPVFSAQQGAGLRIFGGASVDIANCRIHNNYAQNRGAGIKVISATANIRNAVIENNASGLGAGILANTGAVVNLDRCILRNNTAVTLGGGIFYNLSSGELKNCLLYDNAAGSEGGAVMMAVSANLNIVNSTIANNTAPAGGGVRNAGGASPALTIVNTISWGNGTEFNFFGGGNTVSNSIIQGGFPGVGNSSDDPLFVNLDGNDFTLQPCSPAIDTGDNDALSVTDILDLDGNPRIVDATEQGSPIVDMGAYEYQETIPDGSVFIDICGNCIGPDDIPCPPASIAGSVELDIYCLGQDATIFFYDQGTNNLVASYSVTLDTDGLFDIAEVEAGIFDIFVKVDQHLQKGFGSLDMVSGINLLTVGPITIGDLNDDNGINIDDMTLLLNAFGTTTGDPNFNPLADLNCDGGVNIDDLTNLLTNFGQSGDAAPF